MAKALNKSRIRDTRFVLIICFLLVIFTEQLFTYETPIHETLDMLGDFLIAICVVGRVYSTAFLGGHKNATLITYGPFSISRNPLYFFSFIGACGIALMSNHIVLFVVIPTLFLLVFMQVIRREEAFLTEEFGEPYLAYCKQVPRFFPKLSLYHAPETVPMVPKYLLKATKDAVLWFLALPFFELVEYLQHARILQPLFTLY